MRRRVESEWAGDGRGCRAAALPLLAGFAGLAVVLFVCVPVIATGGTAAGLLAPGWIGWTCKHCYQCNNPFATKCYGCGRSR